MATLYELTEQYQQLMDMVYDPEVDEQTLADTMEGIEGEIEDKADGYARIIFSIKADTEALSKEEKRLAERRKGLQARADRMKKNLEDSMRAIGKPKFKTDLFTFGIQKNGGVQPLAIDAEIKDIPDEYLVPQDPLPDKDKIRELLKTETVSWAHLEPRGESLRIR